MIRTMQRPLMAALASIMILAAFGCTQAPRAQVRDLDTYHVVTIGKMRYVTPDGFHMVSREPGSISHHYDRLPGTIITVSVDPTPPRSLKLDAEAEKTRFQGEIPNGFSRSAQYKKDDARERVTAFVEGQREDGQRLYGVMALIRENSDTATVKVVGYYENRDAITELVESVVRAIELTPPPPMY